MPDPIALIIQTNCPDLEAARHLAQALVEERLAAAANIHPGLESIYHWKGEVVSRGEVAVFLKTREDLFAAVSARIRELHPYETPAVIGMAPALVSSDYLAWLEAETGG